MKKYFIYSALALFLLLFRVGLSIATAGPIDLVGAWVGTANVATDTEFSNTNVTLEILTQQGLGFSGTMQFGDGTPFNVNGVVDKKVIHITGSASIFEGIMSGHGVNKKIHGTGSRFETTAFPSATVVFDLHNEERVCLNSGGTIKTGFCCESVHDFPNTCSIGACGCSPASSHEVKICDCGPGKCFDGSKCVSR
jgi:hypothetical protein